MTGPEHYRRAEQLADEAHRISAQAHEQRAALLAEAQVHAALAGVAAMMAGHLTVAQGGEAAWHDALSPAGEDAAIEAATQVREG